jgi:hypothetical protein
MNKILVWLALIIVGAVSLYSSISGAVNKTLGPNENDTPAMKAAKESLNQSADNAIEVLKGK